MEVELFDLSLKKRQLASQNDFILLTLYEVEKQHIKLYQEQQQQKQ
jgi:hypothetical protein